MLSDKTYALGRLIVQMRDAGKLPDCRELDIVLERLAEIMVDIQDIEPMLKRSAPLSSDSLASNVILVNFPRRISTAEQNGGGAA